MAYRLGSAFTSGRKSAPADFQEVDNQLYSLSTALELLGKRETLSPSSEDISREGQGVGKQDDVLGLMINNCRATLSHLESLVNKYTELRSNGVQEDLMGYRKWRAEMRNNWKKVRWTSEGGDLDKLKENLAVHINGLNLAISAITR
jgi:hypothetical protein